MATLHLAFTINIGLFVIVICFSLYINSIYFCHKNKYFILVLYAWLSLMIIAFYLDIDCANCHCYASLQDHS